MTETFLNGRVTLHPGDCLDVLARLGECSVDSIVCDPPYHLTSIVKRFGANDAAPAKTGKTGAYARASAGFMGKKWDGGDVAFRPETWAAVLRVMKPGAHLIAFSGTRTYHRMVCAIEDAGFEIRDAIMWHYGQGFPKSLDVSKAIDREAGVKGTFGAAKTAAHERYIKKGELRGDRGHEGWQRPWMEDPEAVANAGRQYIGATDAARQWSGWGTALKPSTEIICLARKPISESTIAANVLRWGTGALNIDGCRVETNRDGERQYDRELASGQTGSNSHRGNSLGNYSGEKIRNDGFLNRGRWPANLIHDGSEEVVGAFPETETHAKTKQGYKSNRADFLHALSDGGLYEGSSGSAARFFYTAKADSDDRIGSKHPTVKPVDLMQWLVRLVTPPGGLVLDPFAGTGTTAEAAFREGFRCTLIERETEYQADIRRRMALVLVGPDERARESIKAKLADKPIDNGPLFASDDYDSAKDVEGSFNDAYAAIRERVAAGGPGWEPK